MSKIKKKLYKLFLNALKDDKKDRSIKISRMMQPLEARYMFDGAAVETVNVADGVSETEQSAILEALSNNYQADASKSLLDLFGTNDLNLNKDYSVYREVIIVDLRVKNIHTLIENISRKASVEVLDRDENGVSAIADMLSKYSNLDAVHIISHGSQAELYLGNIALNSDNLNDYQSGLKLWGEAISHNGDLLFYGCNVAEGKKGLDFVDNIKQLTQTDIAASSDLTGGEKLNGDNILEVDLNVETNEIIDFSEYEYLLNNNLPILSPNEINTGSWNLSNDVNGDSIAENTTGEITTTIRLHSESINSAFSFESNAIMTNIPAYSNSSIQGAPAYGFVFEWDTSPEENSDATTDGGTGLVTISFSENVIDPIIHLDRLGGVGGNISNSILLTLLTPNLTLTDLTQNNALTHFDVTPTTIQRTPYINLSSGATGNSGTNPLVNTAAGSVQVNGTFNEIQFRVSGVGIEGIGDGVNMSFTFSSLNTITENDSSLNTSGTLQISDFDITDTVNVGVSSVVESGNTSGIDNNTLLSMLSVPNTDILNGSTTQAPFTWNFDSNGEAFDYLALGESLVLTYTITATDSQSATDTQDVVITINGSNDDPVISIEAGDSAADILTETDSGLTSSDTLTVTDLDLTDTVSVAVTSVVESGDTSGIANATLLSMMSVTAGNILDNT
ncbi:DUF4347 domain-containing protein, partial [Thiotrichales bacterium 19X7-9]|nr:DUF4347 domain-containing protein [Thiotrichales bacterium 19X7-9]